MTGQQGDSASTAAEERARRILQTINAAGESPWSVAGKPDAGLQGGVWYVEDPVGRTGVLKIAGPDWARQVLRAEEAVALARRAGYPTPAWIRCGRTADGFGYQLQERVPGDVLQNVDVSSAKALVAVLDRQAGMDPLPGRVWNDFVVDQLTRNLDALCSVAATASPSGPELVRLCRVLAAGVDARDWPTEDMVHGDFRPGNVLLLNGAVTGVVDVEAIGSGTRAFDYATLLSFDPTDEAAVEVIVAAGVRAGGREALRACVALVFLDLVRFTVARADVDRNDVAVAVDLLAERAAVVDAMTRH